jgi:hypothetical protein
LTQSVVAADIKRNAVTARNSGPVIIAVAFKFKIRVVRPRNELEWAAAIGMIA